MQAFQRDLEKFERLDAQVIGVSSDSLERHGEFSRKYNITFPLISDEDYVVKGSYGRGRITYLIDKGGTIRFIQQGVPDNERFLREIEKLHNKPAEE